jgi:hypothetical protein
VFEGIPLIIATFVDVALEVGLALMVLASMTSLAVGLFASSLGGFFRGPILSFLEEAGRAWRGERAQAQDDSSDETPTTI